MILLSALLMSLTLPLATAAGVISPFIGTGREYGCRSASIDAGNVIGLMAIGRDARTVDAKVLYRSAARRQSIELRMMREDADILRREIDALMTKERRDPIRFAARLTPQKGCEYQVSG